LLLGVVVTVVIVTVVVITVVVITVIAGLLRARHGLDEDLSIIRRCVFLLGARYLERRNARASRQPQAD
jgi:hypothetical protein